MTKYLSFNSLRIKVVIWILSSFAIGVLLAWTWLSSQAAWEEYLNQAEQKGIQLYQFINYGGDVPSGMAIEPYIAQTNDTLPSVKNSNKAVFTTAIFINNSDGPLLSQSVLQLHIVSPDIKYPVSRLGSEQRKDPAIQLGEVARLIANYCSTPTVFIRKDDANWFEVDGSKFWGCEAAPTDMRIIYSVGLLLLLVFILAIVSETVQKFNIFADVLTKRSELGGSDKFEEDGVEELTRIIGAVNAYLASEKTQLEKRAFLMSAVSHDLGTPATRLRLRTALIEDEVLRDKLETDIDLMTGMIESVLTYTRSEMDLEEARKISLTSLVQSIVSDYADIGKPVRYDESWMPDLSKSGSVFGGGGRESVLLQQEVYRVLVVARPVALKRAISNLIDNALKYGRSANVYVTASSRSASIIIEDEGGLVSSEQLTSLVGPFVRGDNSKYIDGAGLGLTIVSTIAQQHGGSLNFENTQIGLRSILAISR